MIPLGVGAKPRHVMAAPLLRVALAALCAVHASAAVIGIDFGARFIKVGIIQPGKGIELVLNEASKRKSSSAAGFNSAGERVYADDSFNLLGKLPGKQFVYSKLLLGKNVSHPHVLSFGELGYPYQFSEGVRRRLLLPAKPAHLAPAEGR